MLVFIRKKLCRSINFTRYRLLSLGRFKIVVLKKRVEIVACNI